MFVIFKKHQKDPIMEEIKKSFPFLPFSTFVYLSLCLSLFLYFLSLTFTLLFSEGTKKDPVMEEIKKSLPKNVLDATKKGDLKPFQEHIKNMVTDDEIR